MGLTIARVLDTDFTMGALRGSMKDITLDTSYPTGGYALTGTALIGAGITLLGMQFMGGNNVSGGYQYAFDNVNKKLMVFRSAGFTPAGTVAAPVFTGAPLAAHRHTLHFQTSAAANAVTAAANALRTPAAAFDVAGVADSAGEGGVVDVTAGTPAGTNSAPAFTGTAVAAGALVQVANAVNLSTVKIRVLAIGR